nr:hypothetical protein [Aliarcobacter lanthieri]
MSVLFAVTSTYTLFIVSVTTTDTSFCTSSFSYSSPPLFTSVV